MITPWHDLTDEQRFEVRDKARAIAHSYDNYEEHEFDWNTGMMVVYYENPDRTDSYGSFWKYEWIVDHVFDEQNSANSE